MQTDTTLPVRGNDVVEILFNDHQTIKNLLAHLTQAEGTLERKAALEQLKATLVIHNATEENLVYPALEMIAKKKSESQHLYHETAEASVLVFKLDTMLNEQDELDFEQLAQKLHDAVLEHIEEEEHRAFVYLRDDADPQETARLTQSVREFRSALRFNPGASARSETGIIP